jgi:hypothetical protein
MNQKTKSNVLYVNSRACTAKTCHTPHHVSEREGGCIQKPGACAAAPLPPGRIANLCILDCARHSPMATCLIHPFMRVCVQLDAYKRREQVLQHLFAQWYTVSFRLQQAKHVSSNSKKSPSAHRHVLDSEMLREPRHLLSVQLLTHAHTQAPS